jgi:hypothetical protein
MKKAANYPIVFTHDIPPEEKAGAERIRDSLSEFLDNQNKLMDFLAVLFDSLDELTNPSQLVKIAPLLKRYEQRLRSVFNNYIKALGVALSTYKENLQDLELDNLRDLLVEHAKELRNHMIDLISHMDDTDNPGYVADLKKYYNSIKNSTDKIYGIVKEEWYGHIDYDILGKIRLSSKIPMTFLKQSKRI